MQRAMYCYAWDLADEGVGNAVARFRDNGLNTVTLAGAYHAGKFLRPHGSGKIFFPEDGTVYFKTNPDQFGEIKPAANSLLAEQDVFQALGDDGSMSVNAWLVVAHNSRIGQAYPHITVANAFGDRYVYSLCPTAPAVREYAVKLCTSAASAAPITGLRLETPGYMPFVHGYHHEFGLMRQNTWFNNHMGLCFCDHCRAGGKETGIDMDGLRARTVDRIEGYLQSDVDFSDDMAGAFWTADIVTDEELGRLLRWRCEVVTSLVAEIRTAVPDEVDLAILPSVARPSAGAWYEGSDLAALAAATDGVEVCFYEPSVDRIQGDLLDVKRRVGEAGRISAVLRPGHPDLTSRDEVIGAVAALASGGVHDVAFYNYGHLRASAVGWIGDALSNIGAA